MTEKCRSCGDDRWVQLDDGTVVPCPECTVGPGKSHLPDPAEDKVGKAQRPGAAAVTQRIAAELIYPSSGTQRGRVLDLFIDFFPYTFTDETMQITLNMNPSTQRPRRVELVEQGWLEDSGETENTKSGRPAVIWRLTERGCREAIGSTYEGWAS